MGREKLVETIEFVGNHLPRRVKVNTTGHAGLIHVRGCLQAIALGEVGIDAMLPPMMYEGEKASLSLSVKAAALQALSHVDGVTVSFWM